MTGVRAGWALATWTALLLAVPGLAAGTGPASTPDPGVAWVGSGSISTVATTGALTFAAGRSGSSFGRAFAGPVAVDPVVGILQATSRGIGAGPSISDGSGGWFILQDGRQLVHLDAELHATLSVPLAPESESTGVSASSLALSVDRTRLYVTGSFDHLLGAPRAGSAAVSASTGALLAWQPADGISGRAVAVSPDGTAVYLAGRITRTGYFTAVAAYRSDTGAVIARGPAGDGDTLVASSDGAHLLVQRYCDETCQGTGATAGSAVASLDPATMTTQWMRTGVGVHGAYLTPDGGRAFLGGVTRWDGVTFAGTAIQIDLQDGSRTGWRSAVPAFSAIPAPDGSRVYMSGTALPPHVAAVSTDGTRVLAWSPVRHDTAILAVGPGSSRVLLGGGRSFDPVSRSRGAQLDLNGAVTDFPGVTADPNVPSATASALAPSGATFVGFEDSYATPVVGYLSAVEPDGTPRWHRALPVDSLVLSADAQTLYVAGPFTQIDGIGRTGLAAVRVADGAVLPWAPALDAAGTVTSLAVSADGQTVYLGGSFTTVSGQPRKSLAAVSASDGAVGAFRADTTALVRTLVVSADGSTVYAAGSFGHGIQGKPDVPIGGAMRDHLAALRASDGAVLPWAPAAKDGGGDDPVIFALATAPDGGTVFVGSNVEMTIDGTARSTLAGIDARTGALLDWYPKPAAAVRALAVTPDGNALWVGGDFGAWLTDDGSPAWPNAHLARFSLARFAGDTAPVNAGAPTVSVSVTAPGSLRCSTGAWSGAAPAYAYRWLVDEQEVAGAVDSTFAPPRDQVHDVRCVVTAANDRGSAEAVSAGFAVTPTSGVVPAVLVIPTITGVAEAGQQLICGTGTWDGSPTAYAYAWSQDTLPIVGATAARLEVAPAYVGHELRCAVTASNAGGSASSTSDPVTVHGPAPVTPQDPEPTASAASATTGATTPPSSAVLSPRLPPVIVKDTVRPAIRVVSTTAVVSYGHTAASRRAARRAVLLGLVLSEPAVLELELLRCPARGSCSRRTKQVQALTRRSGMGGTSLKFGELNQGRRLATGRYALTVVARDAAGNRSGASRVQFRVRG